MALDIKLLAEAAMQDPYVQAQTKRAKQLRHYQELEKQVRGFYEKQPKKRKATASVPYRVTVNEPHLAGSREINDCVKAKNARRAVLLAAGKVNRKGAGSGKKGSRSHWKRSIC